MKELKFKIIIRKRIKIDLPLEDERTYPVHTHSLFEEESNLVIYQFEPTKTLDETKYLEYFRKHIQDIYSLNSTEVSVELIN